MWAFVDKLLDQISFNDLTAKGKEDFFEYAEKDFLDWFNLSDDLPLNLSLIIKNSDYWTDETTYNDWMTDCLERFRNDFLDSLFEENFEDGKLIFNNVEIYEEGEII